MSHLEEPCGVCCRFCGGEVEPDGYVNERVCSREECVGEMILDQLEAWEYQQYLKGEIVYGDQY